VTGNEFPFSSTLVAQLVIDDERKPLIHALNFVQLNVILENLDF
jgi:hypothetical protein